MATVNALQASLLPGDLPVVPRIQLAARYHSASPGISVGGGRSRSAAKATDGAQEDSE